MAYDACSAADGAAVKLIGDGGKLPEGTRPLISSGPTRPRDQLDFSCPRLAIDTNAAFHLSVTISVEHSPVQELERARTCLDQGGYEYPRR